jgi:hypothetical protein
MCSSPVHHKNIARAKRSSPISLTVQKPYDALCYGNLCSYCVGFEVLTAVVMKSSIVWDITPCSPLKVNRRFGGTCCLHLHGRRISQASRAKQLQRTTRRYIPEYRTLFVFLLISGFYDGQTDVNSVLVWLHRVNLGSVADVSEAHAASIFMVEVCT